MVRRSGRPDAYLICATPRTGSSLLCGLLESTGVAGHPESYFRRLDEQSWARRWGIAGASDDSFSDGDFVKGALAAGKTENGVFAARVMWGTMEGVVDRLSRLQPHRVGSDLELLHRAFGRTRFLYLWREDAVAQAVSWLRAEQTNHWHDDDQFRTEPAPEHASVLPISMWRRRAGWFG